MALTLILALGALGLIATLYLDERAPTSADWQAWEASQ